MEQIVRPHLPFCSRWCGLPALVDKDGRDLGACGCPPQQEIKDRARVTLDIDLNDAPEVGCR
eukprot:COSAG05_NODE_120_length_17734_cov_79.637823_8_plen_62_part_00